MMKQVVALLVIGIAGIVSVSATALEPIFSNLFRGDNLEFRSINGRYNNKGDAALGAAGSQFVRYAPASYSADAQQSGMDRPNARHISQMVCSVDGRSNTGSTQRASNMVWLWGQFIDHDMTLGKTVMNDDLDIEVPAGDEFFDPDATGEVVITMERTEFETDKNGVRQQINSVSSFLDGSMIYGSDRTRQVRLKAKDRSGRMLTDRDGLLPKNIYGLPNAGGDDNEDLFLAGDIRANEHIGLTALHNLFVLEHNLWVEELSKYDVSGLDVYEVARAIVGGLVQAITFNEFLPALLGSGTPGSYRGYNKDAIPSISNEFAAAVFRFGHSMVPETIGVYNRGVKEDLNVKDVFFTPSKYSDIGMAGILRSMVQDTCEEVDVTVTDGLRNFLFGEPGSGGADLVSLNIQRSRDHGIPSYADCRRRVGATPARSFNDVTSAPDLARRLTRVFRDPEHCDLFVCGLAEDRENGGMLGTTMGRVVRKQFEALRDGDRFWYERYFSPAMVRLINSRTLATIIRDHTGARDIPNDCMRGARG